MTTKAYYTDCITQMPVSFIWRTLRRSFPMLPALPAFLHILIRKMLRWRFAATYGVCYIDRIVELNEDRVPNEVHKAFASYTNICDKTGFRHQFIFQGPNIGQKETYSAMFLHESGVIWLNVAWIHIRLGTADRVQVVFACHSKRASGAQLHTSAMAPENWIPQMVPPNHEFLKLPVNSEPGAVVAAHLRRIEGIDDLLRFSVESLTDELVRGNHETIDFCLAKGFYTELTPREVHRLTNLRAWGGIEITPAKD